MRKKGYVMTKKTKARILSAAAAAIITAFSVAPGWAETCLPSVLSIRERAAAVDRITRLRLDTLLPKVMREAGFDAWIILCNEDDYDPVFNTMVPYDAWCPITQILVFHDPGQGQPLERLNISRTDMMGFHKTVWTPPPAGTPEGDSQWECLAGVIRERDPKKVGINESQAIWAAGSLSASLKAKLVSAIGPKYASRLVSAEPMAVRWLETLLDEEVDLMERAVAISRALIAETFSDQVITPGVTTADDLVFHYRQRIADLGLDKAFRPFFRIRGRHPDVLARYGTEDKVIRPGDVLHCDVGLKYLGYNTDHQELAYVLRRGETDVPDGLKAGMADANRLQDFYRAGFREGLTGNEILAAILKSARAAGLTEPRIYSHSLGTYLHEPGPLIGLPWEQVDTGARGQVRLVPNSCFTAELSVDRAVPEWGGKMFRFPMEQDVVFTTGGVRFLAGRQTQFHIIR